MRALVYGLVFVGMAGCTSVDKNAAASLATAGENATSALSSQADSTMKTLGALDSWWIVDEGLACSAIADATNRKTCLDGSAKTASNEPAAKSVQQIVDLISKRKKAIDTLNQAYTAFGDLAHYNAGQDTAAALQKAFASVNTFTSAASALSGIPIGAISTAVQDVAGGGLSLIADERANKLILSANGDLQKANDALYAGLSAELKVMQNLLIVLQAERQTMYQRAFDGGLIDPIDIIAPVYAGPHPTLKLREIPKQQDVLTTIAKNLIDADAVRNAKGVASTYGDSLDTLHAISAQHTSLAKGIPLTLGDIEAEISNLKADVAQLNQPSTSSK